MFDDIQVSNRVNIQEFIVLFDPEQENRGRIMSPPRLMEFGSLKIHGGMRLRKEKQLDSDVRALGVHQFPNTLNYVLLLRVFLKL